MRCCLFIGQRLRQKHTFTLKFVSCGCSRMMDMMISVFSWLLYVDSWFRGPCVLLEEGQTVRISEETQQNLQELKEPKRPEIKSVGSIRTLLKVSRAFSLFICLSVCSDESHIHVLIFRMTEFQRCICMSTCLR